MLSTFELLQKYDVPGPRYTSYPTVPAWREDVGPWSQAKSLQNVKDDEPLSLYFHLPFCENLCHFCGCFKVITKDHSRSRPYINTLLQEIKQVASQLINSNKKVSQIHLGGGTPNFIAPEELQNLMEMIRKNFQVLPNAEIAVEMHPRTSTKVFCDELKRQGFNRISLGVQSFDTKVQNLINRFQTFEQTSEMLLYLRSLGFESFNFDLIYGLPGDQLKTFQHTLDLAISLNPDRFAVYSYAHVPWKSKIQRSFEDQDLPSSEQKIAMFAQALQTMAENDFVQVGMDHFSKKSDDLYTALQNKTLHRNFMGYSTRADAHQLGFGVSSISFVGGNYYQNIKDITEYTSAVEAKKLCAYRGYELTTDDHVRRDLITEIMCHMEVNIVRFAQKYGLDFGKHFKNELKMLKTFEDDGLVSVEEGRILIRDSGKLVLRNVAMLFDAYLEDVRKKSVNPIFSRTI